MSPEPDRTVVRRVLAAFLGDLADRASGRDLAAFLDGRPDDLPDEGPWDAPESAGGSDLVGPLLDAVGLEVVSHPVGGPDDDSDVHWPDFALPDLDPGVVGVCAAPGDLDAATDRLAVLLDRPAIDAEYGIATDGLAWTVLAVDRGGDVTTVPPIGHADLRPALRDIAGERGLVDGPPPDGDDATTDDGDDATTDDGDDTTTAEDAIAGFVSQFSRDGFESYLSRTVPRQLREARRREVESFADRYVGLLFGAGEAAPSWGCLLDGVRPPPDAGGRDARLFAVALANRLLFVALLAERGVLSRSLLRERGIRDGRGDDGPGSHYRTRVAPLLYDLLTVPPDERAAEHRQSADGREGDGQETDCRAADVPYLGSGLFGGFGPDERRFDVDDAVLRRVVDALVEWVEADGRGLDPAVVGSAFEAAIDHVEAGRTQKDLGAYYTPSDVTALVVEGALEPTLRDVLVETFPDATVGDEDLGDLLRAIEAGEDGFADPEAVREAYERVGAVTVLDPACGSGHFLTAAFDALRRVRASLRRALPDGAESGPRERYRARAALARDCIHGVDLDPAAVEIARMRLRLQVVADAGWRPGFGPLPAIESNLVAGNALVGLPATGTGSDEGDAGHPDPAGGDGRDTALDARYLASFDRPVETSVDSVAAFDALVASIEDGSRSPTVRTLAPTVSSVQARREDGEALGDGAAARLSDLGFTVYEKSARLDVTPAESRLRGRPGVDARNELVDGKDALVGDGDGPVGRGGSAGRTGLVGGLRGLLADGFVLTLDRLPTTWDLDRVPGGPLHWPAVFPAVLGSDSDRRGTGADRGGPPGFDVVVGNPPYGDLLDGAESVLVSGYGTSDAGDVSANFVERALDLLAPGGRFGNVTTLRLVYQRSLEPFHDLLRATLDETRIACFGFRPSRVFPDAHVNTAVITGRKHAGAGAGAEVGAGGEPAGVIRTSDFVLFSEETRREAFAAIEYGDTRGLVLRDAIGGTDGTGAILPKVGPDVKRSVLTTLREYDGPPLGERFDRSGPAADPAETGGSFAVYRTRGVLYWLNPMLEPLYDGSEVEPMYFETARERDAAFLVMQSSLYYVYWLTYSDLHHHNWSHVRPFPFPTEDALDRHADRFETLATRLWDGMKAGFTRSRATRGDFHVRPLKPIVDEVDELLAEVYGLSDAELAFVTGYLTDLGADSGRRAVDRDDG